MLMIRQYETLSKRCSMVLAFYLSEQSFLVNPFNLQG